VAEYECQICKDEKATFTGYSSDGFPRYMRCICATRKIWANRLGPQIYTAKKIKISMLSSYFGDNLFIRGDTASFYSHLRCALLLKGLKFKFKILNDSKIFNIWIGKDKDFDSLQDLVGLDLLVIMMGATIYENRAHAAVIQEACYARMMEGKSIWVQSQLELNEVLKSNESAPENVELFKQMIESEFKHVVLGKSLTAAQKIQDANSVAIGTPPRGRKKSMNEMARDVFSSNGSKK